MSYEVEFGFALKKLRLAKNYSQMDFAKLSKVNRTFISILERGIRQPSLTIIVQLATALKIKTSELVMEVEGQIRRTRWRRLKH